MQNKPAAKLFVFIFPSAMLVLILVWPIPAYSASLEGLLSPGKLSDAHAEIEDNCSSCHDPLGNKNQTTLCTTCHEAVAEDLRHSMGFHGLHEGVAGAECQVCHKEHDGLDAQTLQFDLDQLDHHFTDFALAGAHKEISCASCHKQGVKFSAVPNECSGCHANDDPHDGKLGSNCAACHDSVTWKTTTFNHATARFPLVGAHAWLSCSSCHTQNDFSTAPLQCEGCHQKDDPHAGQFGAQCGSCHSETSWLNTTFDHGVSTGFSLQGQHKSLTCISCHLPGKSFSPSDSTCISCHKKDDPHEGSRGSDCGSCHSQNTWQTTFDHVTQTGFALRGSHEQLACKSCHTDGLEATLPTTCHECHQPDPHQRQLGNDCASCHNETSFVASVRFNHNLTSFPLLGIHAALQCDSCHATARFHDADAQCASCHDKEDIHNGNMGEDCGSCHNPTSWSSTRFEHGVSANFALSGMHTELHCSACHDRPFMLKVSSEQSCVLCHQKDDPHEESFGNDCAQCHNTSSFAELKAFGP